MGCGPSNQIHATIVTPTNYKQQPSKQSSHIQNHQIVKQQTTLVSITQKKKQQELLQTKKQNIMPIVEKPIQIRQQKKKKTKIQRNNFCFLFGQTNSQRKIICFDSKQLNFSTISSKTKIQEPPLKYQPAQVIYQQSQQLYSSNLFTHNSHPPYNFMLALAIDNQKIFLCGGVTYDFDYISSQSFFFDTQVDTSITKNKLGHNLMGTRFQKLPFMNYKRFSHMGVFITVDSIKYIYVFGGRSQNEQILNQCERFSLVQKKWRKISPMNIKRCTGFTFIFKNKVYVFGGYSGNKKRSKKIEVYHPDKDYWQILNVKLHRGIQTGLIYSLKSNQIIIIGGNLQYGAVKSVFRMNIQEQTYIYETQMKYERVLEKGIQTNTQIIVFGGNNVDGLQIFNIKQKRWRENHASYVSHVSVEDINSFSFSSQTIVVQSQQSNVTKNDPNSQEKYCLFSNDQNPCIMQLNLTKSYWKKKPVPMSLRLRSFMGSILIKPGKHFICGGINQYLQKSTRSAYIYYLNTNNCVQQEKMNQKRYSFGICLHNEFVYVFGGKNDSTENTILSSCQKFDIQNNKWIKIGNMNRQRHSCVAICMKQKIYIIGGADNIQKIQQIQIYNVRQNVFSRLSGDIRYCIQGGISLIHNQQIYLFGGINLMGQNHNIIKMQIKTKQQNQQTKQQITNQNNQNNQITQTEIIIFKTLQNVGKVTKAVTSQQGIFLIKKNKTTLWKNPKIQEKIFINQIQLAPLQLQKLSIS